MASAKMKKGKGSGKRGRPPGGVSFCKVSLDELNRILKPSAHVIVSLRFANMIGLRGQTMTADLETVKGIAGSKDAEIKLETFGQPDVAAEAEEDNGLRPSLTLETFN